MSNRIIFKGTTLNSGTLKNYARHYRKLMISSVFNPVFSDAYHKTYSL